MPLQQFIIPGVPGYKGRPRFAVRGKYVKVYTDKKTAAWEKLVNVSAIQAGIKQVDGPVELTIRAWWPLPVAQERKRKPKLWSWRTGTPDLDNVVKGIADGLGVVAWKNDSQICRISAEKKTCAQGDSPFTYVRIAKIKL